MNSQTVAVRKSLFDSTSILNRKWKPKTERDWKRLDESPAFKQHGFRFVGNGQFYSPHEEHVTMMLGRTLLRLATGTFDVQIGDLIPSCTAGDIRVTFVEKDLPDDITIAAAISTSGITQPARNGTHDLDANHQQTTLHSFSSSHTTFSQIYAGTRTNQEIANELLFRNKVRKAIAIIFVSIAGSFVYFNLADS
jgi:hypothetical protein